MCNIFVWFVKDTQVLFSFALTVSKSGNLTNIKFKEVNFDLTRFVKAPFGAPSQPKSYPSQRYADKNNVTKNCKACQSFLVNLAPDS